MCKLKYVLLEFCPKHTKPLEIGWVELVLVVSIARIFHPPLAMLINVVVVIVIVYLVQPVNFYAIPLPSEEALAC